jgi:hypothetical protein
MFGFSRLFSAVMRFWHSGEIITNETDDLSFLSYMRHRDATCAEPIWMCWDMDRGESIPGGDGRGGILAARAVYIKHTQGRTFEEHAKFLTGYTNHLRETVFKGIPLYYRLAGTSTLFVMASQDHAAEIIAISNADAARKFYREHYAGSVIQCVDLTDDDITGAD